MKKFKVTLNIDGNIETFITTKKDRLALNRRLFQLGVYHDIITIVLL